MTKYIKALGSFAGICFGPNGSGLLLTAYRLKFMIKDDARQIVAKVF